jgi:hypothetical protein
MSKNTFRLQQDRGVRITRVVTEFLKTGRGGLRTFHVAECLKIKTATARRWLREAEAAGKIRRSERYSAVNDIYWELVP